MEAVVLLFTSLWGTSHAFSDTAFHDTENPRTFMLRGNQKEKGEIDFQTNSVSTDRKEGIQRNRNLNGLARTSFSSTFPASVVLSNGLINLGIHPTGRLFAENLTIVTGNMMDDNLPRSAEETELVGLQYILPDGSEIEGAAWGRLAENWNISSDEIGWDVPTDEGWAIPTDEGWHLPSDIISAGEGWGVSVDGSVAWSSNEFDEGDTYNLELISFRTNNDSTAAYSEVKMINDRLKIIHDFHESSLTSNLYEISITLEYINESDHTAPINEIRYRRKMDFRAPSSEDDWGTECMTIQPNPSNVTHLDDTSNLYTQFLNLTIPLQIWNPFDIHNGSFNYSTSSPLENAGPADQGATFDFSFKDSPLSPGQNVTFNMYLGAASNLTEAERVTQAVGAEVYAFATPISIGKCLNNSTVFIMAFNGVGGNPIDFNPQSPDTPSTMPSAQPSPSPSPAPSAEPSTIPSFTPSIVPSAQPSSSPSSEPTVVPSAKPSQYPSSVPSVNPSSQPSSNPTNGACVQRGIANACGFTRNREYQQTDGYTSVCIMHYKSSKGKKKGGGNYKKFHFHNECISNDKLQNIVPGDYLGKKDDKILMECGCCDESSTLFETPDGRYNTVPAELKKYDELFCNAPLCTPDDEEWEPCDDGKKKSLKGSKIGKKSSNSDNQNDNEKEEKKIVKTITACIYYDDGTFEEKCVDPFYSLSDDDNDSSISHDDDSTIIDVICGSCSVVSSSSFFVI